VKPQHDPERLRLAEVHESGVPWWRWGPYLAERQWGTVREDYSPGGTAWDSFPHDQARSRAYRWGEDGLLGISDNHCRLCFCVALWNERDPILKERLFGLTGPEGNHGEDVKEYYFYLDCTPTHSYMRALYKYPQRAFPYTQLVDENRRRGKQQSEYELVETGMFDENRYFDVQVEYAKASPADIVVRISVTNRGPEVAPLHVLPTSWFRNTWAWQRDDPDPGGVHWTERPDLRHTAPGLVEARHPTLGPYWLACDSAAELLFTENDTNFQRLWGIPNQSQFVKDGINDAVVKGHTEALNPERFGTKVAAHSVLSLQRGQTQTIQLRLSAARHESPFEETAAIIEARALEADAFYSNSFGADRMNEDERRGTAMALR
jgi:hypothetical protein